MTKRRAVAARGFEVPYDGIAEAIGIRNPQKLERLDATAVLTRT